MLAREALRYKKIRDDYQKEKPKTYLTCLSDFLKQLEKILFSKAVQAIKECITLFMSASILYLALTGKLYIKVQVSSQKIHIITVNKAQNIMNYLSTKLKLYPSPNWSSQKRCTISHPRPVSHKQKQCDENTKRVQVEKAIDCKRWHRFALRALRNG